jgi:hypothetical protein
MGQTNISIRVDEDIKKEAEILCAKIGILVNPAISDIPLPDKTDRIFLRHSEGKQRNPYHRQ